MRIQEYGQMPERTGPPRMTTAQLDREIYFWQGRFLTLDDRLATASTDSYRESLIGRLERLSHHVQWLHDQRKLPWRKRGTK